MAKTNIDIDQLDGNALYSLALEQCDSEDYEAAVQLCEKSAKKGNDEAVRMMEILQPFLVDESKLIGILTDKLVQVAQKPNMRKEFSVTYDAGSGIYQTLFFYKNDPPMSQIEQVFMASYYVTELEKVADSEDTIGILFPLAIKKTVNWINKVGEGKWRKEILVRYYQSIEKIFSKLGDEESVDEYHAQCEECKQFDPKPYRTKKYSFDYWYAEAEKHDWEAMIVVSIYYHYGGFVGKNERLSELWKSMAKITYNYYEPNERPFDEVYAEIRGEMVHKETEESSTN